MSAIVVWGTASPSGAVLSGLRVTATGDVRVTSDGDRRIVNRGPAIVTAVRITFDGDTRVTFDGDRRVVLMGPQGPQYFKTDNVTADGGVPFGFKYRTLPWQPADQTEESVFYWANISISWSMSAVIRLTPFVDDISEPIVLDDGSTLSNVPVVFTLDQQGGTMQRRVAVFPVPLLRRQVAAGVELNRWALRGQRLQFLIESTGALGVGELLLEGDAIKYENVRKAIYASVDASGN